MDTLYEFGILGPLAITRDGLRVSVGSALVREGGVALAEDRPDQAATLLGDALGLWRGEPLADLEPAALG
jgi:hypothetical protein